LPEDLMTHDSNHIRRRERHQTPSAPFEAAGLAPRSATVLVVEDSPTIRTQIVGLLETFDIFTSVQVASDGFEGLASMLRSPPDLVLCDLRMQRCDGMEFLRLRGARENLKRIPVIVLSDTDDSESKVEALKQGAIDFVSKRASSAELAARLAVHLRLKRMYDELVEKSAELARVCRTDALTGLCNRRALRESLESELVRFQRYGRPFSLLMVDVDHFKQLNDLNGHQAGDAVLVRLGAVLSGALRRNDIVGRYGGEEIAIILPETGTAEAARTAERLRSMVALEAFQWESHCMRVTISTGVATAGPNTTTCDDLVRDADRALYQAKHAGRNRVVVSPFGTPALIDQPPTPNT